MGQIDVEAIVTVHHAVGVGEGGVADHLVPDRGSWLGAHRPDLGGPVEPDPISPLGVLQI